MVQPGTGQIRAMAENRPFGANGSTINYAVDTQYGGSAGVQTGSSSKLFTLVTALEQGIPFGFTMHVPGQTTVTGYTNCQGAADQPVPGHERGGAWRLYPESLHRHDPVHQRLLRRTGEEGRTV